MTDVKKLLKTIDGYRDFIIDLQTKMTACPAVTPHTEGGLGETAKAQVLLETLKAMKFDEVKLIEAKDPASPTGVRPNIVAKYYGEKRQKTLWVMAHMDVVPAGDLAAWKTDPFKAVVKGDKIYGRGTEDNQQGLVSGLLAVKAMMDAGVRPPVNYGLLFNADEEVGSDYGIITILKKHGKLFGKDDSFIVPDGGNAKGDMVEVAEKNLLWLKVTVTGKTTHASTPQNGNNAFVAAAHLVVALRDLYKKFNKKDRLFDVPYSVFEPTKHEPNVPNVNTIPGQDVFYVDCRVLPCYTNKQVIDEANKIAKAVAQVAGVMGAKRTPDIIPMCHPILLGGIDLSLALDETRHSVEITASVRCDGRTGVEMEALTAVSTAALTVYDMCKAVQKDMIMLR